MTNQQAATAINLHISEGGQNSAVVEQETDEYRFHRKQGRAPGSHNI